MDHQWCPEAQLQHRDTDTHWTAVLQDRIGAQRLQLSQACGHKRDCSQQTVLNQHSIK